jgi:hypothetical protein
MKAYGGMDVWIHVFLMSALVGSEWPASGPCRFTRGTHWIGRWLESRAGLDDRIQFLTLPGLELGPLGRLARSQSLHRLLYRCCNVNKHT